MRRRCGACVIRATRTCTPPRGWGEGGAAEGGGERGGLAEPRGEDGEVARAGGLVTAGRRGRRSGWLWWLRRGRREGGGIGVGGDAPAPEGEHAGGHVRGP